MIAWLISTFLFAFVWWLERDYRKWKLQTLGDLTFHIILPVLLWPGILFWGILYGSFAIIAWVVNNTADIKLPRRNK